MLQGSFFCIQLMLITEGVALASSGEEFPECFVGRFAALVTAVPLVQLVLPPLDASLALGFACLCVATACLLQTFSILCSDGCKRHAWRRRWCVSALAWTTAVAEGDAAIGITAAKNPRVVRPALHADQADQRQRVCRQRWL